MRPTLPFFDGKVFHVEKLYSHAFRSGDVTQQILIRLEQKVGDEPASYVIQRTVKGHTRAVDVFEVSEEHFPQGGTIDAKTLARIPWGERDARVEALLGPVEVMI